jgi:ParB/RepB/Spo0J family partition protein
MLRQRQASKAACCGGSLATPTRRFSSSLFCALAGSSPGGTATFHSPASAGLFFMQRNEAYDVYDIPPGDIYYDGDFNCRGEFTVQSLKELAESIATHGLQFPVVVQPMFEADVGKIVPHTWRLLAGHRRYRAVTMYLRWPTIPAMIRRGLSLHEARVFNLVENLERKDLNPLEEALAIGRLYPHGATPCHVATELKKSAGWVRDRFRLMKMPEPVRQLVAARRIALSDLIALARLETPEQQIKAAETLASAKRERFRNSAPVDASLRTLCRRRTKGEINAMIGDMFQLGINGLPMRVAAWCAGLISSDELNDDFRREFATKRST